MDIFVFFINQTVMVYNHHKQMDWLPAQNQRQQGGQNMNQTLSKKNAGKVLN